MILKKTANELLPKQASPKLDPVNLDQNFAAATEVGAGRHQKSDSPSSSEDEVFAMYDKPLGWHDAPNISLQGYSLSEAWKINALVNLHVKIHWQGQFYPQLFDSRFQSFIVQNVLSQNM